MRRKYKKLTTPILAALIFAASFGLLVGCAKDVSYGDVKSFHFGEAGYPSYYSVDIELQEDGTYRFISEGFSDESGIYGTDLFAGKQGEIPKKEMERLAQVIKEYNLDSWDGFNKEAKGVLDGNGFTLEIEYTTGKGISATGYMKWPKNYDKARDALYSVLHDIVESYSQL